MPKVRKTKLQNEIRFSNNATFKKKLFQYREKRMIISATQWK